MDAEVTYSEPKTCIHCAEPIRTQFVNGKQYSVVQADPLCEPTKKNPNPIYQLHKCGRTADNV